MHWFNTFCRAWMFEVSSKLVNDKYFDKTTFSSLFIQLLISHFISFIIFKVLHMRKCTLNNRQSSVDAEKNMWVSNLQIEFVCRWMCVISNISAIFRMMERHQFVLLGQFIHLVPELCPNFVANLKKIIRSGFKKLKLPTFY